MPYSEVSKIAHLVEKNRFIKINGNYCYFNFLNYLISLIREDASSVGKQMFINDHREQVRSLVAQEHYDIINTSRKRSYESLTMLEIEKSKKKSNKVLPGDQ